MSQITNSINEHQSIGYEELVGSLETMQTILDLLAKSYVHIALQLEQAKTDEHMRTGIDVQLANVYIMYPLIQMLLQIINDNENTDGKQSAKAFAITVNNSMVLALRINEEPKLKEMLLNNESTKTIYNLLEYIQQYPLI